MEKNISIVNDKRNCLNLIRLLAALQVLYGHTIYHLDIDVSHIFTSIIGFFSGVPIFFMLSGFLIWHSISRTPSFLSYLKKRVWRIYPELWVAVVFELIVLPLLYDQSIDWFQYGLFAIGQLTIFQFWTPECLRGYGVGCPNGSLWTICVLIQFYILAYFMYKFLHEKKHFVWWVVILGALLVSYCTPLILQSLPETLGKLYGVTLIPYLWMFLVANYVADYKELYLPLMKKYWIWIIIITNPLAELIH